MTISTDALNNRTMGAFTVSIGTSLALESLASGTQAPYDPEREIPNMVNISDYDEVWINIMTLYRNIHGALEKGKSEAVMPDDIAHTLDFEIELIKQVIEDGSHGKTKAIFYACDYDGLVGKYPHARVRVDNTDKQRMYHSLLVHSVNAYFKLKGKQDYLKHFKLEIKPDRRVKALMITHFAYDLLSSSEFNELDLLESHTGILKKRAMWYTKLTDGKNLARIPFAKWSMQVFGDSQTFYPNFDKKVRQNIIDIAEQYKWNSTTTSSRVHLNLGSMMDGYAATLIRTMV